MGAENLNRPFIICVEIWKVSGPWLDFGLTGIMHLNDAAEGDKLLKYILTIVGRTQGLYFLSIIIIIGDYYFHA